MESYEQFAELQWDVLKEIGNIGSGHAATSLSKLLGRQIGMLVPRVALVDIEEMCDSVGGPEEVVVSIFLRVTGDVTGNLFFILSPDSANRLLDSLFGLPTGEDGQYSDLQRSALCEIGNILAGSYLTSLADFTGLNMTPNVPSLSVDMAGAIISYGLLEYGQLGDRALLIETTFMEGLEKVKSHFFLLPDPGSFAPIFRSLGVPDR